MERGQAKEGTRAGFLTSECYSPGSKILCSLASVPQTFWPCPRLPLSCGRLECFLPLHPLILLYLLLLGFSAPHPLPLLSSFCPLCPVVVGSGQNPRKK